MKTARVKGLGLLVILGCLTRVAFATEVLVAVDPGSYAGEWRIPGIVGTTIGSETVSAEPGTYSVKIADIGLFSITVASDGTVTPDNTVAATGGIGSLSFNNATVDIEPDVFAGSWRLFRITGNVIGIGSAVLVPGLPYSLTVGDGPGTIEFTVAHNGIVTSLNPAAATGNANVLILNTVIVNVHRGAYTGSWRIFRITGNISNDASVVLVPAVEYRLTVGDGPGFFDFDVAPAGEVIVPNGAHATASGATVTFNTTPISVDPAEYEGSWRIFRIIGFLEGPASVTVVPAVRYRINIGDAPGFFDIDVAADGQISVVNGTSADAIGNTVAFETTSILVNPGAFADQWRIFRVSPTTEFANVGSVFVVVVPEVHYRVQIIDDLSLTQDFSVAEPCAVNPTQFPLAGATWNVTCEDPDNDADGVPDVTDNCPAVPNPDQIDQDLDGLGNECDDDLDGDGLVNLADNCPDIANAAQQDSDGDSTGDACDLDADGDAVADTEDNCPSLPNPDQANSDGDGLGDVCDPDDDNDYVADTADNCPLDANADQADFDSDGAGDACDGDVDGDGIASGLDLCPLSPVDQPVNSAGCTGAQFISLECPQENFVQHGQFVSCVAHAASEAVDQGLLTQTEKARFVKEAARSNK